MNAMSIEFMGPEYVVVLAVCWAAAMVVALAAAGIRQVMAQRDAVSPVPANRAADDAANV